MTIAGGAATILAGRAFALRELSVMGTAVALLPLAATMAVRLSRVRIQVQREVRPNRVPVDGSCRVELLLRNTSIRHSPVMVVRDPVGDGQWARLHLAPMAVGHTAGVQYRLPVHRRGILTVGPLEIEVSDPFGLATRSLSTSSMVDVIVLPRIHDLAPIPAAPGDEPESRLHTHRGLATAQDEFSTLREFQPGDDVRRVHWPSTARLGRPVVRHFDEPWQRRTTVVVDVRASNHTEDSFERAVSAAASVVSLCSRRDEPVRLVTTAGYDSGFITDDQALDAAMDLLAGVKLVGHGSLTGTLRALLVRRVGGTLVTCTATVPGSELAAIESAGSGFAAHVAVSCAAHGNRPSAEVPGTAVVVFDSDTALGPAWAVAVRRLESRPWRHGAGIAR